MEVWWSGRDFDGDYLLIAASFFFFFFLNEVVQPILRTGLKARRTYALSRGLAGSYGNFLHPLVPKPNPRGQPRRGRRSLGGPLSYLFALTKVRAEREKGRE